MQMFEIIKIMREDLNFLDISIEKLKIFERELLSANKKHNLISKNTERQIWFRHILDSAQLVKYVNFKNGSLSDLGTGGGFPGIVLAIFNQSDKFHVKLFEKSPVKRIFLSKIILKLKLKAKIFPDVYVERIDTDYVVCRAFKKLSSIIQVSREIISKPHELIVLKGKKAQKEIDKAFKNRKYTYKLENSITEKGSKILMARINK